MCTTRGEYLLGKEVNFINLKIDMTSFVDLHKVVGRKSAFSALSSAQNKNENKKNFKNERKEEEKEKKPRVNLIFSHVNHIFFILDPKPLNALIVP
jgi:hypothetical protein